MGARDCDEITASHRLSERFRSANDGQAEVARSLELGVIVRNGGCHDQLAHANHMVRVVPARDRNAKPVEVGNVLRIGIAPGNGRPAAHA
jgi:hypothetical protein